MSFAMSVIAKATIILLCTAVLTLVLRRASASMRHAVWILAMVSVVLLPLALMIVPQFEWSILPQASTSVTFLASERAASVSTSMERGLKSSTTYLTGHPRVVLLWLAGVTVLFVRFLIGTFAVRWKAATAVRISEVSWREVMAELSATFRIQKPVRFLR
jgi:beta-lactamase regulating signal transducer with metallopeptidase domain